MSTTTIESLSPDFNKLPQFPPREELINDLEAMLPAAHLAYFEEHVTPRLWSSDLHQSVVSLGVITVAKVDLMPQPPVRRKALIGLNWLPVARNDLNKFILEAPESREFLRQTILFDTDLKTEQKLNRIVFASVVERRVLSPDEFAAEVVRDFKTNDRYLPRFRPLNLDA